MGQLSCQPCFHLKYIPYLSRDNGSLKNSSLNSGLVSGSKVCFLSLIRQPSGLSNLQGYIYFLVSKMLGRVQGGLLFSKSRSLWLYLKPDWPSLFYWDKSHCFMEYFPPLLFPEWKWKEQISMLDSIFFFFPIVLWFGFLEFPASPQIHSHLQLEKRNEPWDTKQTKKSLIAITSDRSS